MPNTTGTLPNHTVRRPLRRTFCKRGRRPAAAQKPPTKLVRREEWQLATRGRTREASRPPPRRDLAAGSPFTAIKIDVNGRHPAGRGLGREPINLPAGRLARVRYAPDSRRIIAKQRNDALGQFQTSSTLLPFDATFIPSFWMDATESCAESSAGRWYGKPRTLLQTFAQAWALRTPRRISGRRARTARRRR